jgi:hypothetical protein
MKLNFDRLKMFASYDWTCQVCGVHTPPSLVGSTHQDAPCVYHKVPPSMGGKTILDNVTMHLLQSPQKIIRNSNG